MTKEEFLQATLSIPHKPGIYKYFNEDGIIIYVGKAKNLHKRVSSYFNKNLANFKTHKLVSEIHHIEFSIVNTEQDAFLLENSLIKQYQPKYNMMLKDDKSYPYIVIKNERFPRVFLTRRVLNDGSEYIGPFTSVERVREILELVNQTLPFRSCNLNLSKLNIQKQKFKPCLEYHIGNCKAPCVGLQTEEEYNWNVEQLRKIFKGKLGDITKYYKKEMESFVEKMEFEKAEIVRRKLEYIKVFQSKSIVVSPQLKNYDVCSIISENDIAIVNYLAISSGSIIHTHTIIFEKKLDETDEEILNTALDYFREKYQSSVSEIIAPIQFEYNECKVIVPKSGDKKKLLELSLQNAQFAFHDQRRKKTLLLQKKSEEEHIELLKKLQHDLKLKNLPTHIECFDNSNFQGAYPVAAMVCFKNAQPSKSEYRHFHIKTVEGINDFESMKEVVYRRYKRLLDENKAIPQLIIIDGGKGQLNFALKSIESLGLRNEITIVGLAKNVEEIFFPGDKDSIKLPYQSDSLNLLKRIRDEVHRFGITFHRKTRSKGIIKNELEQINGIGEKISASLLSHFKSVSNIKKADLNSLEQIVGSAKAKIVFKYFKNQNQ
ncbi:MAG: excinuclease ABC subunit C [Chitinophagaceae bacterium]|nr:MAG: excinuclease ABC subunit C [Bacteroidetes bacterium OLB11]MCC6447854.1 excinuclease ABC subunit C [Chitinophagaceae bacterium]HMN32499.1 excinuclease ABC subunit UvrC [Chitinophagaceae bacterium]